MLKEYAVNKCDIDKRKTKKAFLGIKIGLKIVTVQP